MLTAIETTQVACGWDGNGEEETFTQELSDTRRDVTVEEALALPSTTHLYLHGRKICRPGHYEGAMWEVGDARSPTLAGLLEQVDAPVSQLAQQLQQLGGLCN